MTKKLHNYAKSILISLINDYSKKKTKRRPNLYKLEHYVDVIYKQLRTGSQWSEIESKCHSTTYHKKFMEWSKEGLFRMAHEILVNIIYELKRISKKDLSHLSIDSSMIKNNRGCDGIGSNHYDRYRNATKVSVVVTDNGLPLGFSFAGANVHDTKMVSENLDNIKIKIVGSRLLADKGYNSLKLKKALKEDRKINLIYPLKKNQKNKYFSNNELKKLKGRTIVENYFAWMKSFHRLLMRFDTYLINYASFCYLGAIDIICNKIF
jgi:transposase